MMLDFSCFSKPASFSLSISRSLRLVLKKVSVGDSIISKFDNIPNFSFSVFFSFSQIGVKESVRR